MPLQNRVLPTGEIVAIPARGTMMGNRGGSIHGNDKVLGPRRWASRQWICCVLNFRGRQREVMAPNRYTELFFLDEATALAAGHRPCFECRRADAIGFANAWAKAFSLEKPPRAGEMDVALHRERLAPPPDHWRGDKHIYPAALDQLPDGAFHLDTGLDTVTKEPRLVWRGATWLWTPHGYRDPRPVTHVPVAILTPRSITAALKAGYRASVHETAKKAV